MKNTHPYVLTIILAPIFSQFAAGQTITYTADDRFIQTAYTDFDYNAGNFVTSSPSPLFSSYNDQLSVTPPIFGSTATTTQVSSLEQAGGSFAGTVNGGVGFGPPIPLVKSVFDVSFTVDQDAALSFHGDFILDEFTPSASISLFEDGVALFSDSWVGLSAPFPSATSGQTDHTFSINSTSTYRLYAEVSAAGDTNLSVGSLNLAYAVIPEPSGISLLGLAGLFGALRRRRA